VDFRLAPAQQLLAATAREFLKKHCPVEVAQRLAGEGRGLEPALWRRLAELGWPGLLVPAAFGGSDGSLLDVIVLAEEMGRAALPGPFVPSAVVATSLLVAAGRPEQQKRWLPALATGEGIVTTALAEDDGRDDADAVRLPCAIPGRLSGGKRFVPEAHAADAFVVSVREAAGVSLVLLPRDRGGLGRLPLDTLSGEPLSDVTFEDVAVEAADRLGGAGEGARLLPSALRAGALARTAEMVGAAQRILELAVEHAKTRVQGGRPIGAHQAIQHACADIVRDVDGARGLLYAAAWSLAEGLDAAAADVATAKAYAAEACLAVARRAHQIFGAIGYCEEHPLHLLHKRIQAAGLAYGDAGAHLETVARSIGLEA
jgi:3-oxocholest-4-en-26-oyl-CoA dehydrogenase beta subunit